VTTLVDEVNATQEPAGGDGTGTVPSDRAQAVHVPAEEEGDSLREEGVGEIGIVDVRQLDVSHGGSLTILGWLDQPTWHQLESLVLDNNMLEVSACIRMHKGWGGQGGYK
jgi:hypothetical protein